MKAAYALLLLVVLTVVVLAESRSNKDNSTDFTGKPPNFRSHRPRGNSTELESQRDRKSPGRRGGRHDDHREGFHRKGGPDRRNEPKRGNNDRDMRNGGEGPGRDERGNGFHGKGDPHRRNDNRRGFPERDGPGGPHRQRDDFPGMGGPGFNNGPRGRDRRGLRKNSKSSDESK
ncbi:hypothetical protein OESDEN_24745 [Oesophagostomum dentatum]|uniref:Uncharacterized protein n=1 Tax=Oesophagostomum dentatum TaxID=61180 RepID=A0A0B1RSM2_OESDE|nr:hypothetical protein OESDEN_24745 [Oesophagostomum dentatum]